MKKFLLLVLFSTSLYVYAQNMPSVAGVTFGDSYANCKRTLDNKFNAGESSYQTTPNVLAYYNVSLGGWTYDYVSFEFQSDGAKTYLCFVGLFNRYETYESQKASNDQEQLVEIYSRKYKEPLHYTNEEGFENYLFGDNPVEKDHALVVISIERAKTQGGDMKLWTKVCYGPIFFVRPEDEI